MRNVEVGDTVFDNYVFFPWSCLHITCSIADQTKTQVLSRLGLELDVYWLHDLGLFNITVLLVPTLKIETSSHYNSVTQKGAFEY